MAASEQVENAGSDRYHNDHMSAIFKEGFSFSGYERDLLLMSLGDGTFADVSGISGVDSISDGRGSVFADFDNDGDVDIFLTTVQREAHFLFRNNVGNRNGFVRVELEGVESGRDAFGAVVRVASSLGTQTKMKAGGSGYLSQHDGRLLFGLGDDERAEWIEVTWPTGASQRIENVPSGTAVRIVEGQQDYARVAENRFELVDPIDRTEELLAGLGFGVGEPFPALELHSQSGEKLVFQDLLEPDQTYLVNLWATWCVPCAKEMPELERIYPELAESGIRLIGVSVDLDTVENVPSYLQAREISYPIYTTNEAGLEMLYPRGEAMVPLTLFVDGTGRILEIHPGWSEKSQQAVESLVARGGR